MRFYYEFLNSATSKLANASQFKYIYLIDGTQIFNMNEIPEFTKVLYVSCNEFFKGLQLTFKIKDFEICKYIDNKSLRNRSQANHNTFVHLNSKQINHNNLKLKEHNNIYKSKQYSKKREFKYLLNNLNKLKEKPSNTLIKLH